MTRPFDATGNNPAPPRPRRHSTWRQRVFVLGGFAAAALWTAASLITGIGGEATGPLWMAAAAWTVPASLAVALWRGFRHGDWSAFKGYELPGDGDLFDWTTQTGEYAYMPIAEEHERLMRGD